MKEQIYRCIRDQPDQVVPVVSNMPCHGKAVRQVDQRRQGIMSDNLSRSVRSLYHRKEPDGSPGDISIGQVSPISSTPSSPKRDDLHPGPYTSPSDP